MNLSGIIAVLNMLGNAIENLQAENAQLREQITMLTRLQTTRPDPEQPEPEPTP